MARTFHAWNKYHEHRISIYKSKAKSINKVWEKLYSSVMCDVKRAMAIWKGSQRYSSTKLRILNRMIYLKKKMQCQSAILQWKNWSMRLEHEVRVTILKQEFSQKIFMTSVFNAIKYHTQKSKHRGNFLKQKCLKALEDNVKHKKQQLRQNVFALRFT